MEKTTRVQKYKELRDSMKEEVSIERNKVTTDEEGEDDFLSFLKNEDEENNDILKSPLSYETLDDDSVEVKEALNQAKVNVGKNQYNTRLDILNKIKNEEKKEEVEEDLSAGHVVNGSQKKMSLLEKLASMSDDEEEVEYEEDVKVYNKHEAKEETKVEEKEEDIEEQYEEFKENNEEKGDKLLTVLNVIIIVLIIAFLALIGLFIKQLLF
jgi:hypothetical protein